MQELRGRPGRVGSHDPESPRTASTRRLTTVPEEGSVTLGVVDQGVRLEFSFADLMRYHGPGSPGGVAHAYQVLERALPLLARTACRRVG